MDYSIQLQKLQFLNPLVHVYSFQLVRMCIIIIRKHQDSNKRDVVVVVLFFFLTILMHYKSLILEQLLEIKHSTLSCTTLQHRHIHFIAQYIFKRLNHLRLLSRLTRIRVQYPSDWSMHESNASGKLINIAIIRLTNRFFIILTKIGIDWSGFKATHASQYYTERVKIRRKYIKLSLAADVLQ
jgi:hypothetical protein